MRLSLIILTAIMVAAATGCVSVGKNDASELPWSAPASWEGQTLGIPY